MEPTYGAATIAYGWQGGDKPHVGDPALACVHANPHYGTPADAYRRFLMEQRQAT